MKPGGLLKRVQFRLTPETRRKLQYGWEFLNFGVLGLNSFVLLYLHSARSSIQAVICAGMAGYALVLLLQIFLCRSRPHPRRLHHCAEAIAEIDAEMLAIRRNMEYGTATTSELAQRMERLERLELMLY